MVDAGFHVRQSVRRIAPYNAGLTEEDVRARYDVERVVKLASNENPLGPSPLVGEALRDALLDVQRYPDPSGHALRTAIAARCNVEPSQVLLGNGSEDLLSVICRAVLSPGDTVVTFYPSFPLHEDYAGLMDARVERIDLRKDLSIDVDALVAAMAREPRMVMFANPMNPAGCWLDPEQLQRVVDALRPGTLLVVDEAYLEYAVGPDFVDAVSLLAAKDAAWVSLRTFSKAWGLAGLRIGYGVCGSASLCELLDRVRTPFNTNRAAQAAALAALNDPAHVDGVVALARRERERVAEELRQRGCRVAPSRGNFLFFDCGGNAVEFCEKLLRRGVVLKPWKQAGYENFARVTIGLPEENTCFLDCHLQASGK